MGKERLNRQLDIVKKRELDFDIHLIGAGGIGSWTALLLAKMGCQRIFVYDNDVVEDHNVASQFFKESQLGMKKLEALKENVKEQTGVEINIVDDISKELAITSGLVIIAIDSMEGRIEIGNALKDNGLFILDARMGGLQLEIYKIHSSRYLETTCDPIGVSHDPCTAKSISFNCAIIGGLLANCVRQYAKKTITSGEMTMLFDDVTLLKNNYETDTEIKV